jgi:hypothetical protein
MGRGFTQYTEIHEYHNVTLVIDYRMYYVISDTRFGDHSVGMLAWPCQVCLIYCGHQTHDVAWPWQLPCSA